MWDKNENLLGIRQLSEGDRLSDVVFFKIFGV